MDWGTLHWEVQMIYEKPEVFDFGSIAEHTYLRGLGDLTNCFAGGSGDKPDRFWGSSN